MNYVISGQTKLKKQKDKPQKDKNASKKEIKIEKAKQEKEKKERARLKEEQKAKQKAEQKAEKLAQKLKDEQLKAEQKAIQDLENTEKLQAEKIDFLPSSLRNLPFTDAILRIKKVMIPSEPYPYNASIIEFIQPGQFHLFFRTDIHQSHEVNTRIGYVTLNRFFDPTSPCRYIDTKSVKAEDPRVFRHHDKIMVTYNDLLCKNPNKRSIHLTEINPYELVKNELNKNEQKLIEQKPIEPIKSSEPIKSIEPIKAIESSKQTDPKKDQKSKPDDKPKPNDKPKPKELITELIRTNYITNLDQGLNPVEKNWIPFIYQDQLFFQYYMLPHQIFHIIDPQQPIVSHLKNQHQYDFSFWEWGQPRGGTSARLIRNEYLAFFHSSFRSHGYWWYVMGVYTFQKEPPFLITKMSPHPIMFDEIYHSPINPKLGDRKRIIYPTGIAFSTNENEIHVSCGENDSTIKILTFNLDNLLKSLIPVNQAKPKSATIVPKTPLTTLLPKQTIPSKSSLTLPTKPTSSLPTKPKPLPNPLKLPIKPPTDSLEQTIKQTTKQTIKQTTKKL